MTLMVPAGPEEHQHQPLSRGLSGIFRKKSKGGSGQGHTSVFEADGGDALDAAFGAPPPAVIHRQGSRTSGGGRAWGILASRKHSSTAAEAAATQQQQALHEELAELRAACGAQERELAGLGGQLAAARAAEQEAHERLNLQCFKFELLVDLWAMRVLDNEELGAQQPLSQQQPQVPMCQ